MASDKRYCWTVCFFNWSSEWLEIEWIILTRSEKNAIFNWISKQVTSKSRLLKYIPCIAIASPVDWYLRMIVFYFLKLKSDAWNLKCSSRNSNLCLHWKSKRRRRIKIFYSLFSYNTIIYVYDCIIYLCYVVLSVIYLIETGSINVVRFESYRVRLVEFYIFFLVEI